LGGGAIDGLALSLHQADLRVKMVQNRRFLRTKNGDFRVNPDLAAFLGKIRRELAGFRQIFLTRRNAS
jgi:hypothetical protein